MRNTTFERLGGFARVRLIVSDFYQRVLGSAALAPYFAGVDMRRLIDHQTKFTSAIMGGPAAFTDEQIARAHARLGIANADFDELLMHFRESLEDAGVDPVDVSRLCAHVDSLRDHVVREPEVRAR